MQHGKNIYFTRVVITIALLEHETSHSQNTFFFPSCTIYYSWKSHTQKSFIIVPEIHENEIFQDFKTYVNLSSFVNRNWQKSNLQIAERGEDDEKLQVRIVRPRTLSALPEAVTSQTVVIIEFSFCGSKLVGIKRVNIIYDLGEVHKTHASPFTTPPRITSLLISRAGPS